MPSFLCLLWGPALIKLPLLDLFLTFATDWRAGLSSAQPLSFSFLGKSWICASNVLKLAPKLISSKSGTQLSRLILDFLYLCSVTLNWSSIFYASFCIMNVLFIFSDQIPIFLFVTKFQIFVDKISIFCPYLWIKVQMFYFPLAPKFKCSVLFGGPNFNVLFLSLGTKFDVLFFLCGPNLFVK